MVAEDDEKREWMVNGCRRAEKDDGMKLVVNLAMLAGRAGARAATLAEPQLDLKPPTGQAEQYEFGPCQLADKSSFDRTPVDPTQSLEPQHNIEPGKIPRTFPTGPIHTAVYFHKKSGLPHLQAASIIRMDKQIDPLFERVERALSMLVDSITQWNPSNLRANELVTVDAELVGGLATLEKHQQNHKRIQQLKQTSQTLDSQIRDTVKALYESRKELKATSATEFPSHTNLVNIKDMLEFARRISRNTYPPQSVSSFFAQQPVQQSTPQPDQGTSSAAPTPSATPNGTTGQPANGSQPTPNPNIALPDGLNEQLHPPPQFQPFPSDVKLRSGALAALATLERQGINPEGYDPAEEEARKKQEEEEARAREQREHAEREERIRKAREQARAEREKQEKEREKEQNEDWRRASVSAGANATVAPNVAAGQFQFMGGEDDDSD